MCRPDAAAVQALLVGGANIDARYRLPGGRSVTPLTWAAICYGANKNNTEYGYPGFSIEVLLEAGANILVHVLLHNVWLLVAYSVKRPGHVHLA
jgi:hypothetical protein